MQNFAGASARQHSQAVDALLKRRRLTCQSDRCLLRLCLLLSPPSPPLPLPLPSTHTPQPFFSPIFPLHIPPLSKLHHLTPPVSLPPVSPPQGVVYRDIKPENLLVDEQGKLKLCDFGFARFVAGADDPLTDYVATRWYRAPELLLGSPFREDGRYVQSMYSCPIDMWAIGCLMGELMDGDPLFAGESDLDQLYKIQRMLGPITHEQQGLFDRNPQNAGIVFNIKDPVTLAVRYKNKTNEAELDFMAGLLRMDPNKRMTGQQCLEHPYLAELFHADMAAQVRPPHSD